MFLHVLDVALDTKRKRKKKAFKFLNIGFERKMNLGDTFTFF